MDRNAKYVSERICRGVKAANTARSPSPKTTNELPLKASPGRLQDPPPAAQNKEQDGKMSDNYLEFIGHGNRHLYRKYLVLN